MDGWIVALESRPRMLVFSNPSNPAGLSIAPEQMRRLMEAIAAETILIFDHAYYECAAADPSCPDFLSTLKQHASPWWMLRTFSKAGGAGLRFGYGIASEALLADLMDRIPSEPLQNASSSRAPAAMGYRTAPSCANFVFGGAAEDASALAMRLLSRGGIVKPWREPGLEERVRVSLGSPRANDQVQAAWNEAAERNSHVARKANV